jgi:hypothetical protein
MCFLLRRELVVNQSILTLEPLDVFTSRIEKQAPVLAADATVAVLDGDVVSRQPSEGRPLEAEPDVAAMASTGIQGVFWYGIVVKAPDEGVCTALLAVWDVSGAGHPGDGWFGNNI